MNTSESDLNLINDNVTNVVIQLKSAAPFTNYVDHANIDRGYMPDSICSIFSRLDIKCRYSWDRKTKLFIDENSITAKTENTIIKIINPNKLLLLNTDKQLEGSLKLKFFI